MTACLSMLKIQDKNRRLVPLSLNRTQTKIVNAAYQMKEAGRPVRILELKGRQQGSSTGIGAYCFLRTLCEANTNSLIITEEKSGSARNIFSVYKRFADNLPFEVARDFTREGTLMKFSDPLNSQIRVEGEKKITSFTYNIVHCSEAAFFSSLAGTLAMLYQTVPDNQDTAIFLETTANQHGDDFYQEWIRAVEEKADFMALFIPWFDHDEYRTPFANEEEKEEFGNQLSDNNEGQYGDETLLVGAYDLSLEALNWRRSAIRNRCQGSLNEFDRQYPSTWETAFKTAAISIFDMARIDNLKGTSPRKPELGTLFDLHGSIQFRPQQNGIVTMTLPPEPDYFSGYVVGADVAEGLDTGDFSCAVVMKRLPLEVVCVIKGRDGRQVDIDEFVDQIRMISKYYDDASILVESNADGGSVNRLLTERGCRNVLREKDVGLSGSERLGWRNTSTSRRMGVALLQTAFNSGELDVWNEDILSEFSTFVTVNGRPQAINKRKRRVQGMSRTGFFDDGVFACIGAVLAHEGLPAPRPNRWHQRRKDVIELKRWRESRNKKTVWDYV